MTPFRQGSKPVFYHVAGDCFWSGARNTPLTAHDIDYLHGLYRDECTAAHRAGDDAAFAAAISLLTELLAAKNEQARWARCTSLRRAA